MIIVAYIVPGVQVETESVTPSTPSVGCGPQDAAACHGLNMVINSSLIVLLELSFYIM